MHQLLILPFNPHNSVFETGIRLTISQKQKLSLGKWISLRPPTQEVTEPDFIPKQKWLHSLQDPVQDENAGSLTQNGFMMVKRSLKPHVEPFRWGPCVTAQITHRWSRPAPKVTPGPFVGCLLWNPACCLRWGFVFWPLLTPHKPCDGVSHPVHLTPSAQNNPLFR